MGCYAKFDADERNATAAEDGAMGDNDRDGNDNDKSCGCGGDDNDRRVEGHLDQRNCSAAANGADGEAARLTCAATVSSSAGAVGPRARSDACTRDAGSGGGGGGGGGSGNGYDGDDDDNEINSAMLYSLQSSFHSIFVRSVLEQQLNAATLSMSPTKWKELLEI